MAHHSIVTNGYCFTGRALEIFKKYPLQQIQITLDGDKEHHDKIRKLKTTGEGSFDVIISNMENILEQLPDTTVSVRVNIDKNNQEQFYEVWKYIRDKFKKYLNKLHVYPGIIKVLEANEKCWNCNMLDSKGREQFYYELDKKEGAFVYFYPSLKFKGCIATSLNGYVIGPLGELYRCWNDMGDLSKSFANIKKPDDFNVDIMSKYMLSGSCFEDSKCQKCFFLPICAGGCPYERVKNIHENYKFDLCTIYKDEKTLNKCLELFYFSNRKKISWYNFYLFRISPI